MITNDVAISPLLHSVAPTNKPQLTHLDVCNSTDFVFQTTETVGNSAYHKALQNNAAAILSHDIVFTIPSNWHTPLHSHTGLAEDELSGKMVVCGCGSEVSKKNSADD